MLGTNSIPNNHAVNNIQSNHNRIIAWLTGLLTLLLALFAFVLSFNALADLAKIHNVSIPFLFPFVVEAGVIIFSLNALHRSLTGQSAKWQWTLIIVSSLLAGTFNIAHADNDILSRAMAAMPSLFLLLSFESFLSLIKYSVTRQNTIVTLAELGIIASDKQAELDKLTGQIDKAHTTLSQLKDDIKADKMQSVTKMQEARQSKVTERRQEVLSLLQAGMSEDDMADKLNVSVRTIQRDLASLNGKVATK